MLPTVLSLPKNSSLQHLAPIVDAIGASHSEIFSDMFNSMIVGR